MALSEVGGLPAKACVELGEGFGCVPALAFGQGEVGADYAAFGAVGGQGEGGAERGGCLGMAPH